MAGLGRSMQAVGSGYTTSTGTVNGNTFSGTYTSTTYDPARAAVAQSIAQQQTNADFDAIRVQGAQKLAELNYSVLKDNTLMPGEIYSGIISLKTPDKTDGQAKYTITIPFAGETHSFQVTQTKLAAPA